MRLVSNKSDVELAWDAYDRAAIDLQRMYSVSSQTNVEAFANERQTLAIKAARLWERWRILFLRDEDEPRPAA